MRVATRLILIVAGSAMFNATIAGVARPSTEAGCKTHKQSSGGSASSRSRHRPVIPLPGQPSVSQRAQRLRQELVSSLHHDPDDEAIKEASEACRLAAEQGDAPAQFRLGVAYAFGQGQPRDYAEAAQWWRCGSGDCRRAVRSRTNVLNRIGVPYDLIEARMWLNLAGAQGYGDAIKQRDIVAAWIGSATEIADAERLAAERGATGARLAGE
jgi:TPR repeat protein